MLPAPILAATAAFVATCIAADVRTRRIPNLLSGLGIVTGLALNTAYSGGDGFLASLAGLLLIGALLVMPFALGGLGGGDVKMMGAVGAFLGPRAAFVALLVGMVFGGAVMAVHLARRGRLGRTVKTVGTMTAASILGGSLEPLRVSADAPGAIALPYSVPLGLGTLAALAISEALAP